MAAMDAGGVDVGLLAAWRPKGAGGGALIGNDEVAALRGRAPGGASLACLAAVDPDPRPVAAVRGAAARCVKELGFKGLRVIPWLWGLPPNDRRYYPLFAECVELGVPFCTQVGHTGPLRTSETGRPIPYLDDVALHFPELIIVAGHVGYPWTEEMIALARKYPNVYIDTSAYTIRRYPARAGPLPACRRTQEGPVWHELPDDPGGEGARGAGRARARGAGPRAVPEWKRGQGVQAAMSRRCASAQGGRGNGAPSGLRAESV